MTLATALQIVRIVFMIGGSAITAKTGLTFDDIESAAGPVATSAGAIWSLWSGIKARKAAK